MVQNNMNLSEDKIRQNLPDSLKDIKIAALGTIDSTNSYAKGEFNGSPLLVLADGQTQGRGRLGKSFFSPLGTGLYMSLALKLPAKCDIPTAAAAVAVCRVIDNISAEKAQIKWVNDIFVKGKKVCGILCESVAATNNTPDAAIIGIGVNLSTTQVPDEISHIAGSLGGHIDRNQLAALICTEIFDILDKEKKDVLSHYESRLFILGKEISFIKNGISYNGTAVGINESANLFVRTNSGIVTLSSGEISLNSENFV